MTLLCCPRRSADASVKDWLFSQGIINDDEPISRTLNYPPVNTLSVADLPPIEHSDDEGAEVAETASAVEQTPSIEHVSVPPSPRILRSPEPAPSTSQAAHTSGFEPLGLGPRPQAPTDTNRVSYSFCIRPSQWDSYL